MLEIAIAIVQSPFAYLVWWTFGINLFVQSYKLVVSKLGVRNAGFVEATLPLLGPFIGAVTGAIAGDVFGISVLVTGERVTLFVGAFFGTGIGFVANGIFAAVKAAAPEGSKVDRFLAVYDDTQGAE